METYIANSLGDIATSFDSFAADCFRRSKSGALTQRDVKGLEGQAYAWNLAADMLRKTQIVPDAPGLNVAQEGQSTPA